METLTGAIVDVSGSMRQSIGKEQNHKESRGRSVFNVIDNLIRHDVSSSNHVFVFGFGARREPQIFDVLSTIEKANKIKKPRPPSFPPYESYRGIGSTIVDLRYRSRWNIFDTISGIQNGTHWGRLQTILDILERNGAPRVREWAKMSVLYSAVSETDSEMFLDWLAQDTWFRHKVVYECLPESCRQFTHSAGSYATEGLFKFAGFFRMGQEVVSEGSVQDAVGKAKQLIDPFVSINENTIMDVHKASRILRGCIGQNELSDERVDELMELVEPFIYGQTPLMETLQAAADMFAKPQFNEYKKLLFILSDGKPTDGCDPPADTLSRLGVKTVCCYITNDPIDNPRRLYSHICASWDDAAKLMFQMSSHITTQMIPRTIFLKRGWTIDIDNNKTQLFVQVNHPDIIKDVCELATDVVCCQDALSDLLSSVSVDLYINQATQGFVPKKQLGGTCYANATAAVLHLAMLRIVGREGGYPDFFQLRNEMTAKFGMHGANIDRVLQEICPRYRLHWQEVDVRGALAAVTAKRPVLAKFYLTDDEWAKFSVFYQHRPRDALTKSKLDITQRCGSAELSGHAVVLTSFSSRGLRLMNSWGSNWGDGGFFTVDTADVLRLQFVDIFWKIHDLKQSELDAYKSHGAEIAQKLISRLRGLQTAQYKCPLCHNESNVNEFTGHALETTCPKCGRRFNVKEADNDLALNLYLLLLSAPSPRSDKTCQTPTKKLTEVGLVSNITTPAERQ